MLKPAGTDLFALKAAIATEMFFQEAIISWYSIHKRFLPWRHNPEPYKVWLSEIILQQTRVDQGLPYYEKFIRAYPDLLSFANAPEEDILKLWQGLGYYSRARNMLVAANQVITEHGGEFPLTAIALKKLKGIGDYTGAAISSACFNEPVAVVDGNVYRVLSRFFGIALPINESAGKKLFAEIAQQLLPGARAGIYNQAIMDFGALQCKPQPVCPECTLKLRCIAYADNLVKTLPVKSGKTKVRNRYFNYLVILVSDKVFIQKRGEGDIWQGLFDFPLIETAAESDIDELLGGQRLVSLLAGNDFQLKSEVKLFKHILSHQVIYARFWEFTINEPAAVLRDEFIQVEWQDLENYAMSRLARRFLDEKEAGV